jgi:hypothetical protein
MATRRSTSSFAAACASRSARRPSNQRRRRLYTCRQIRREKPLSSNQRRSWSPSAESRGNRSSRSRGRTSRSRSAQAHARGGEEARALLAEELARDPNAWQPAYNAACFEALTENADAAFEHLARAFALGPERVRRLAANGEDFAALRSGPTLATANGSVTLGAAASGDLREHWVRRATSTSLLMFNQWTRPELHGTVAT